MARVPDAASFGLGQGPGKIVPLQGRLQVQASPEAFGAQQARQIGALGQDIGQAGGQLLRVQQAVEERDARTSANKFGLEARKHWLEDVAKRELEAPPGAPNYRQQLTADYAKYRDDALKDLQPGLYRDLVQDDLDRLELSLGERAVTFEAQARRSKAETDQKAALGLAGSILATDPGQYAELLARQLKDIEGSAMPAAWKEETARAVTADLTKSMVLGLIEQEPHGTAELLRTTPYPGLEGNDQAELLDLAQRRAEALDNDRKRADLEGRAAAKVELDAANEDRIAKATDGHDFGPLPTDADWQTAHSPTTWQAAKARFEDRLGRARALGSLVGMSLPEIRQTLIDRRPNPALPGYAQQQDEYNRLVQAAAETERQIRTDPAGFAMRRSPAVAQAYQDAGGDPAKVGRAVNLSLQVQREMGVPDTELQPLPKQQAEVLGQHLATINEPQQQVATIKAWLETVEDPAIRRRFAASLEKDGGLPKGFTRAVDALERDDAPAAVRIMTALKADQKIADKTTLDNVGTTLDNVIAGGGLGRVAQLTGRWTGDNRNLARLAEDRAFAERLAAYSVAGGMGYDEAARLAARDVWGTEAAVIADENLGAVVLPAGTDDDRVSLGLATIRSGMPVTVEEVRSILDPKGVGGVVTERGAADLIDDWKDQARWINDGDGFALLVPIPDAQGVVSMRKLPGHRWTLEEVQGVHASGGGATTIPAGRVQEPVPPEPIGPGGAGAPVASADRERIYAVIETEESGGKNVVAVDPDRAPEDRATGPMQVMPETARETAAEMGITELAGLDNAATQRWMLAHPDQARAIGRRYLDKQLDKYGDPALAAAAYHSGPGNVDKWLAEYGDPRTGEVTLAFWLRKVKEAGNPKTAGYVERVAGALA